jgi:hypothetical protein
VQIIIRNTAAVNVFDYCFCFLDFIFLNTYIMTDDNSTTEVNINKTADNQGTKEYSFNLNKLNFCRQ